MIKIVDGKPYLNQVKELIQEIRSGLVVIWPFRIQIRNQQIDASLPMQYRNVPKYMKR